MTHWNFKVLLVFGFGGFDANWVSGRGRGWLLVADVVYCFQLLLLRSYAASYLGEELSFFMFSGFCLQFCGIIVVEVLIVHEYYFPIPTPTYARPYILSFSNPTESLHAQIIQVMPTSKTPVHCKAAV